MIENYSIIILLVNYLGNWLNFQIGNFHVGYKILNIKITKGE